MSIRDMGKASFAVLQDSSGKIQLYIRRDDICPGEDKTLYDKVWKHLCDMGDIIGVKGYVFTTKTGETSVHVQEFQILTKSLKPLPVVKEKEGETFDAVTDPEFKYRQRYADLIINPEVKETFLKTIKNDQCLPGIPERARGTGSGYTCIAEYSRRRRCTAVYNASQCPGCSIIPAHCK